ncbi:MAG: bifunctional 3-(3-hydroxy-phenyl)propionate/3-hydroxycinnamic acid hydroxylase [Vicinamibacterales bacterium]
MSDPFDVAVVGCGPVGAFAGLVFARAGLRTLVLDAADAPHPLPRAVHIDHEMMRLLQSVGVIAQVSGDMRETEGHLHIGADGGVIRYMGTVGRPRPYGWANDYFFYQPEFEAHLRGALLANGNVTLRLGARVDTLDQREDGVVLHVATPDGAEAIRARWVVGCDGARSTVRRQLGIELDDLDFEEPWLVVDAEVQAPLHFPAFTGVPPAADLQRLSVMLCDPARPATIVPGRGTHRRWEFMLLPGESEEEMTRPDRVEALIRPWLHGVPFRLVRATTYRFHGLVARRWRAGRVFLAGDAAHQTPPFFGQGMCHGFRDVANLAWKLALVGSGRAQEALLDTYQSERDPHVRAVISAAIEAGRYICVLDPQKAAERDSAMRARSATQGSGTAADLIPALAAGVVAPGAGERFVQPWVAGERGRTLLDDVTGTGWRVLVHDAMLTADARDSVHTLMPDLDMSVIDVATLADGGTLADWFAQRRASIAVIRPDFYVFGTCAAAHGLAMLLKSLRERLSFPSESRS